MAASLTTQGQYAKAGPLYQRAAATGKREKVLDSEHPARPQRDCLPRKSPWFAPFGMSFAERFVNRSLAQVTRYLTNDAIRLAAIESASKLIGPETKLRK